MQITTEECINRFKKIHSDTYDYSKVEYKGQREKVCIICPKHGEFYLTPKSHYRGNGCPICGREKKSQNKRMTFSQFLELANKVHKGKYQYDESTFKGAHQKLRIICPIHGEFWQQAKSHYSGSGCQKCYDEFKRGKSLKYTKEIFVEKAIPISNGRDTFDKVEYVDSQTKVCVTCKKHGDYWIAPSHYLQGERCIKCAWERAVPPPIRIYDFVSKAKSVHGEKYDYSLVKYVNYKEKVDIICPIHGKFSKSACAHIEKKRGCPICSRNELSLRLRDSRDEFIEKVNKLWGTEFFDLSNITYTGSKNSINVICKNCGREFTTIPNRLLTGHGCPYCIHTVSNWEKEIKDFLNNLGCEILSGERKLMGNRQEIDIYLPSLNLAIECDGIYFHNEKFRDKDYHLSKTLKCNENGIHLIHIFEDEWKYKGDIVRSMLANMVGFTPNRIYARKCIIKEVSYNEKKVFLNENHIQGDVMSKYNLGLYYNDELVSLMTFGKLRINVGSKDAEGQYELLRFCNKLNTNVIGGASKLFKHFIRTVSPKRIKTFCDLRYYNGGMYEILGFKYDHTSQPNYFYVINDTRENRFKYRKDVLVKEGYDKNMSEHEIMLSRGIYRIYDCGAKIYYWDNEQAE